MTLKILSDNRHEYLRENMKSNTPLTPSEPRFLKNRYSCSSVASDTWTSVSFAHHSLTVPVLRRSFFFFSDSLQQARKKRKPRKKASAYCYLSSYPPYRTSSYYAIIVLFVVLEKTPNFQLFQTFDQSKTNISMRVETWSTGDPIHQYSS